MSTSPYYDVLRQIQTLTPAEQLRLLGDLAALMRHRSALSQRRSILELRGLGKEIWDDVDPQEYVNGERASWNG